MKQVEELKELIACSKLMQQAETLIRVLNRETCRAAIIEDKFAHAYGFNKIDLLPTICQHFYEKGKEDAKKEIKDSLE
jgi:hypothetical protein